MSLIPFQVGGGSGVQIVDGSGNPISTADQITAKGAQTYTASTSNQTISSGLYLSGNQVIAGAGSNFNASNIKKGKNIFGITGTMEDMNSTDPWWNYGAIVGKPFEGGYYERNSTSSKTYYHHSGQSLDYISCYAGYGSGVQYTSSRYSFDATPYRGFRFKVRRPENSYAQVYVHLWNTDMSSAFSLGSLYPSIAQGETSGYIDLTSSSFPTGRYFLEFDMPWASSSGTHYTSNIVYVAPILR